MKYLLPCEPGWLGISQQTAPVLHIQTEYSTQHAILREGEYMDFYHRMAHHTSQRMHNPIVQNKTIIGLNNPRHYS